MIPADLTLIVGVDVGKTHHHAVGCDRSGATLLNQMVANDEGAIRTLLASAGPADAVLVVVDRARHRRDRRADAARDRQTPRLIAARQFENSHHKGPVMACRALVSCLDGGCGQFDPQSVLKVPFDTIRGYDLTQG